VKVKCIDNYGWSYLTIGKTYDVIEIDDEYGYKIIDDSDYKNWYEKELFKTISEIRNEIINKLLEDES
jgi:hypothetical protein